MDGPALSWSERRKLNEIENDLRADRELERELTGMRLSARRQTAYALDALRRIPAVAQSLLVVTSVGLLAAAVRLRPSGALVLFGLVWAVTLAVLAAHAAHRWHRRHPREREP
ncbi:hypothetical protein [Kitasatospora purpeofusca]|uniref:hypothetical protein n=1 Tax=Kitasatospora purpeofusca TaxID=67352 RepID=UPI002A5A4DD8|nr:hypothetical protein [Kitasatospora purpeofusca]MDY0810866.1 hypothetical protein [Kitasatospora purpeofusca]